MNKEEELTYVGSSLSTTAVFIDSPTNSTMLSSLGDNVGDDVAKTRGLRVSMNGAFTYLPWTLGTNGIENTVLSS